MTRTALLLACLIGLSGCAEAGLIFVGANVATLIHADKTIPDFALSAQSKENCSLLHAARNEPYCQSAPPDPREALAAMAATRYCYRTLGGISCYDRPDYTASSQNRVNFAAGYPPTPSGAGPRAWPAPLAAGPGNSPGDPPGNRLAQLPPPAALPGEGTY